MKTVSLPKSSSDEEGLVDWINRYGWYLVCGAVALMVVSVIGYRMSAGSSKRAEMDYVSAEKEFQAFQKGSEESLERLTALLARYPDLHAKYDGLVAQQLLNRGEVKEGERFVDLALLRNTDDHLPFYTDYTVITLMLSKGDFHEALDKTLLLKKEMLNNVELAKVHKESRKFGDILFAFNLLREALLLQRIGDKAGEKRAWGEFKQYAGLEKGGSAQISPVAFRQLLNQFESGKESLVTFIQHRERQLES